jgi:hypothetical protein
MQSVGRRLAFVLASSNHGTMIANRFDYRMVDQKNGYGVGFQILVAKRSITQSHPIMLIKKIKTDAEKLRQWLKEHGYEVLDAGINMLAIHQSDKTLTDVRVVPAAQPAA